MGTGAVFGGAATGWEGFRTIYIDQFEEDEANKYTA